MQISRVREKMEFIKRCPFCGSVAVMYKDEPKGFANGKPLSKLSDITVIQCSKCTANISAATGEKAIADWNRRADNGKL